jgi:hypothetical protein
MHKKGTGTHLFGKPRGDERGFQLNLPAKVTGRDASGREFEEETKVDFMSQAAATFDLKTPVIQGGELKLILSLPQKLSEDKDLKLAVRGRIAYMERRQAGSGAAKVFLKLESRYIIKPDPDEKP